MKAELYFIELNGTEPLRQVHEKINLLYQKAQFDSFLEKNDLVAIKIHFGEKGNTTHIPAHFIVPIINNIKAKGAKPFLTDTNVLYRSERMDAVSHIKLAEEHGFTLNKCDAPILIADGLRGNNEIEVQIHGKLFQTVSIASEVVMSNSLFVLTHVTGHMATGIGGALKNLGMGLASRKGKLRQHSSAKPWVKTTQCTGCGQCMLWCPVNAIEMKEQCAFIQTEICIGCGECVTVCRYDAISYNWKTSNSDLQKKMSEHALGAVSQKKGKVAYMNFLISITKDCDCLNIVQKPLIPDIGILAGKDPVALDKASLDLIKQYSGKTLTEMSYPHIDETVQLHHAQEIGLGTMDYRLNKIDR